MIGLVLGMMVQAAPPQKSPPPAPPLASSEPQPDDIVVTATTKAGCVVRFADKDMSDADLDKRAAEWKAGKPVRVISRVETDFPCVRKIAMKLFDRGVMKVIFVDPQGRPALPFDRSKDLPRYTPGTDKPVGALGGGSGSGGYFDLRAREHNFISRTASQLILDGKCDQARTFALTEGDLDAAAAVVAVCQAKLP